MRKHSNPKSAIGVLSLCCGLMLMPLLAASPASGQISALPAQAVIGPLHLEILEGDGALNNIRQRDAREPAVQVTDGNHKPVAGAAVLFAIQSGPNGATATFASQASTFTVTTGPDGIARPSTLQLGKSPGSFTVAVTATVGALVATAIIHEANFIGPLSASSGASASSASHAVLVHHTILGVSKPIAITVGSVVAAGIVIGVVEATRNQGTSITLGTGTITGPK